MLTGRKGMSKKLLTPEQKRLDTDLWIILMVTLAVFLTYVLTGNQLMSYVRDSSVSVIPRLLLNAAVQFGVAGLGITIVMIIRKEKFSKFGLVKENALASIIGAVACFIPYICYLIISRQFRGYQPFRIMIANDVLKSGFPVNVAGMLLIALVSGFFEGFNYAVISDKINGRYPSKNRWLDAGAITCAIICILFHPFTISLMGIIEMITTFIAIYGMLQVKNRTGNAWGCVFAFCFIWNAF